MAELFRGDPAYASDLLNSILEDGEPGELFITVRQMKLATAKLTPHPLEKQ
jgi:hypothetical protein